MLWLDFLLFGHGHGLAQPYFDGRFYWLSGRFYTWIGGLGAQLQSFQWMHPKPGEERRLAGRTYRPFNSYRKGPRVCVSWRTKLPDDLDRAQATIRFIKTTLGETVTPLPPAGFEPAAQTAQPVDRRSGDQGNSSLPTSTPGPTK